MISQAIFSPHAPPPPPFLSQAVSVGGLVFCSGQIGAEPETGILVQGSIKLRTKRILQNLTAILEAAGASLSTVVKVNIYLTNIDDFSAINEVYMAFFPDKKPARTCVGVRELPMGTDVEIECVATVGTFGDTRL